MNQYESLEIYPNLYCQLACPECHLHGKKDELDEEKLKRILKKRTLNHVKKRIDILGGEPTLWRFLPEFLHYIRNVNKNVKITVTTNGITLARDEKYFKSFIDTCINSNTKLNISWHNNIEILPVIQECKRRNILDSVLFVPSSLLDIEEKEKWFKKLKGFVKCVWRPVIFTTGVYPQTLKIITEKLKNMPKKHVQSSSRVIDRKIMNNIEIIKKANESKDFYKNFLCRCGKHGVIFADGKMYHCLSQALQGKKEKNNNREWIPCQYDFCCCDTFDLRRKNGLASSGDVLAL